MTDAEIDALWLAHRDAGDMRGFGRAVADAAYTQAAAMVENQERTATWATFSCFGEMAADIRLLKDER